MLKYILFLLLFFNINKYKCLNFTKIADKFKKIDETLRKNYDRIDSTFFYIVNHIFNDTIFNTTLDDVETSSTNENEKCDNIDYFKNDDKNENTNDNSFMRYIKQLKQKVNSISTLFDLNAINKHIDTSKKHKQIYRSDYQSFIYFINQLNKYSILSSNNWNLFNKNILTKIFENVYILNVTEPKPKKSYIDYINDILFK